MDQHHLDRIRLLSTRFRELQGLRVAFAGVCMTLVIGGYLIASPQPTNDGAMVAMLVSFVPVAAGMPRLNRYYATTFGRQVWSPPRKWHVFFLIGIGYSWVGWWLHATIPAIPAGAPTTWIVALLSLWVAIRDWPTRAYYLGATAGCGDRPRRERPDRRPPRSEHDAGCDVPPAGRVDGADRPARSSSAREVDERGPRAGGCERDESGECGRVSPVSVRLRGGISNQPTKRRLWRLPHGGHR